MVVILSPKAWTNWSTLGANASFIASHLYISSKSTQTMSTTRIPSGGGSRADWVGPIACSTGCTHKSHNHERWFMRDVRQPWLLFHHRRAWRCQKRNATWCPWRPTNNDSSFFSSCSPAYTNDFQHPCKNKVLSLC
jgi:hypothetical protein